MRASARAHAPPARSQAPSCFACARHAHTLPGAPPQQAGCSALRPTVQRGAGLSTNDTTGRWWDVMDCHGCAARDYRAELVAGEMFNLPRVAVKGAGRGVFSATFRCAARPAHPAPQVLSCGPALRAHAPRADEVLVRVIVVPSVRLRPRSVQGSRSSACQTHVVL